MIIMFMNIFWNLLVGWLEKNMFAIMVEFWKKKTTISLDVQTPPEKLFGPPKKMPKNT